MKKSMVKVIAVLAALVLTLLSACGTGNKEPEPTKAPEANEATAVPATQAPAVTEAPVVTDAPAITEAPAPTDVPATDVPADMPEVRDPGTEYYFDYTEYGEDYLVPDPNEAAGLENYEQGVLLFPQGHDPYVWIILEEPLAAAEYRYVAVRVMANKNDKNGQLRFATSTDDRGWAMLSFKYQTPGSWETLVFDLAQAALMNDDTMDGELTRIRIDPYDDEFDTEMLADEYTLLVESFALFTDPEKAQAYNGLYEWPEDPDKTPLPATATPDGGSTPAPTHRPTERPAGAPEVNDIGTEYYCDFTEYGDDEMAAGPNNAVLIEQEKEGMLLSPEAWDPYVWVVLDPKISASEFRYVALKVKAQANDKVGQIRFVTTTDSRGWPMIAFQYADPGDWEVIVLDLAEANFLNPDTLDGDLVRVRIDPYDDEADPQTDTMDETHVLLVESIAFFNDKAKAEAYTGLYKWGN